MMKFVGIDPGSKGAIVLLDPDTERMTAWNIPILKMAKATKTQNVIDAVEFYRILRDECGYGEDDNCHVFIEDVHSMPTDGHVGAFTFGMNKGALLALVQILQGPYTMVHASKWKGDMRCSADKNHTKRVARSVFPDCLKEMTNEGKHEAALIALWGMLGCGVKPMRFFGTTDLRKSAQSRASQKPDRSASAGNSRKSQSSARKERRPARGR